MAKNNDLMKKIRAGNAVENNGKVLLSINLLRHEFIKLKNVYRALAGDLSEQEYLDSINYLSLEGYISLRDFDSKADARLADADYLELEALVTSKGIRLLGGIVRDEMVDV